MNKTVVFVNFSGSWGGGENWHFVTARELIKKGWNVIFFIKKNSELEKKCDESNIKTFSFKTSSLSFLNYFLYIKIKKILQQISPKAVILNASKELKNVALPANKAGVEKIIYRRGIPKNVGMNRFNIMLFKKTVTHLIVNSENTLKSIQPLILAANHLIPSVIYNGLSSDCQYTADLNSDTIAVIARLSHEKGVDRVIDAMQAILLQIPNARLLLVGDGPERENLEKKVSNGGLSENVTFTGFINNVSTILQKCSIFVLPSRMEGFGYVLLEAMRLKIPCIAYSNTAAAEIIDHKKTGILIESNDKAVENLAKAIVELLTNKRLCKKMGQEGYNRFIEKFTLDRAINNTEKLLLE